MVNLYLLLNGIPLYDCFTLCYHPFASAYWLFPIMLLKVMLV